MARTELSRISSLVADCCFKNAWRRVGRRRMFVLRIGLTGLVVWFAKNSVGANGTAGRLRCNE